MLLALEQCKEKEEKPSDVVEDPLNQVLIKIGDTTGVFSIDNLRQFDYFETLFSERWMARRKEDSKSVVDVLGPQSSQKASFGCHDLELLIESYDCNNIPFDEVLTCDEIDSYCYCRDFFTSTDQDDMVKYLVEYFENRTPSIDIETREKWLLNAKHPMFRAACLSYNKKLSQQKAMLEHDIMVGKNAKKLSGSLFKYDEDTAALLFRKKFKISFESSRSSGKKLKISNFDQEEWNKLWNSFDMIDYWHYFGGEISYLVDNLKECTQTVRISKEEYKAVTEILYRICDHIVDQTHWESPNIPFNVTRLSIVKSILNLNHQGTVYRRFGDATLNNIWSRYLSKLDTADTEEVTVMMLRMYKLYSAKDNANEAEVDSQDRSIADDDKAEAAWWGLIKKLLSCCSGEFLIHHTKHWFPVMHGSKVLNTEDSVEWVLQTVVPKLSTQLAFNFGLYLAEYAVFQHKNQDSNPAKSDFPKRYFEFMKKEAGIAWDVAVMSHPEGEVENT